MRRFLVSAAFKKRTAIFCLLPARGCGRIALLCGHDEIGRHARFRRCHLSEGFCKWMNLQEDMPMGKLRKQNSNLPAFPRITPDKTETFAGKWTARVTKIFNQPDGSIIKATRKINKDGSITDKIEHRHK